MTMILNMSDYLPQSPIKKKLLFISENSIHIKRALALCSSKYSEEICDSVFFFPSSLAIAINNLPWILTQFLVREKAKVF